MNNILGSRLKILRLEAKLTQEEFGKPYSLKKSTVSQYESGSSRPDDELKKRIAKDFNVSLDWLMGISDIRRPSIVSDSIKNPNNTDKNALLDKLMKKIETLDDENKKELEKYIDLLKLKEEKDKKDKDSSNMNIV